MVKLAYPVIYRPRSIVFSDLITVCGIPTQEVLLLSPEDEVVKALYLMETQANGQWRISGCFLLPVEREVVED